MHQAAVGSTNPVKVGAARRAFTALFPDIEILSRSVPSGVSEQPATDEETIQGAIARARGALEATGAAWGIGLEGGVRFEGDQCWLVQFCAVAHRDGRIGLGAGPRFLLPPAIGAAIRQGGELGPLFDQVAGVKDIKKKGGAIGFLTNGLVMREDLYFQMVAGALVRFLHPELYEA